MSRRFLALAPVVAALTLAAPALADTTQSVTATGTSESKVVPTDRHSSASIAAAVAAAQKLAVPAALGQAHANALLYAQDVGLTLGSVLSVSDAETTGIYGPFGPGVDVGPFGPGQYCGTERRAVTKRVGNKVKVVRVRKVHTCDVPPYATATLTVTYSAS
jgi:hypothetical protein